MVFLVFVFTWVVSLLTYPSGHPMAYAVSPNPVESLAYSSGLYIEWYNCGQTGRLFRGGRVAHKMLKLQEKMASFRNGSTLPLLNLR